MPLDERVAILNELLVVDEVITFDDSDGTGCGAIEKVKEMYKDPFGGKFHKKLIFCNGGDRGSTNTPEVMGFANNERVRFEYGIGGTDKMNSSSWILHGYFERQKKLLGI